MAERDWWLRTLLVLQRPRAVFAPLRSDDPRELEAREEPILALIFLAGIAGVLSTDVASRIMDDFVIDKLTLLVWVFVAGAIYGVALYFLVGFLVYAGARAAGAGLSYRRARHVLAFACVPLVCSLIVWPVRLAVYGEDTFRSGGSDSGAGAHLFEAIEYVVLGWCAVLLVLGLRTVGGWSWVRALLASLPALAVPAVALGRASGVL
jgi:Yip1-like protein